jgi:hypothetical protein
MRLVQLNELFPYIIPTVNGFTAPHFSDIILISNFHTIELYVSFNKQEIFYTKFVVTFINVFPY